MLCSNKVPVLKGLLFTYAGVLEEAEFYNVAEVIQICKDRIKDRDGDSSNKVRGCINLCIVSRLRLLLFLYDVIQLRQV